jgi:ABC-type glycerol-3-phosphate transport system substrate-binding protein
MSNQGLKSIFEAILPDYDKESVYTSDMKKVFVWYNLLLEKGLLDFSESTEGETEKEEEKEETTEQE